MYKYVHKITRLITVPGSDPVNQCEFLHENLSNPYFNETRFNNFVFMQINIKSTQLVFKDKHFPF